MEDISKSLSKNKRSMTILQQTKRGGYENVTFNFCCSSKNI